jgi:hypothetical protein
MIVVNGRRDNKEFGSEFHSWGSSSPGLVKSISDAWNSFRVRPSRRR